MVSKARQKDIITRFSRHAAWPYTRQPIEQRKATTDRVFNAYRHPYQGLVEESNIERQAGRVNPRVGTYYQFEDIDENTMNVYNPRKGRHGVAWTISPSKYNDNREGRHDYRLNKLKRRHRQRKKEKEIMHRLGKSVGNAYTDQTLQWEDPVTLTHVPRDKGYYIGKNVVKTPTGSRATTVYHLATLKKLLASKTPVSPMTRRPFGTEDVFKLR